MKTNLNLKVTADNFSLTELERLKITNQIETEILIENEYPEITLKISKSQEVLWTLEISVQYSRAHLAVTKTEFTLESVLEKALEEIRPGVLHYRQQLKNELFHFDSANEYDFYTEMSQTSPGIKKGLSILVVEDDPAATLVLQATLSSLGCKVDTYSTPTSALKAICDNRYDLVVLDWNLPYMNAGHFLMLADKIRGQADVQYQPTRQTAVVICTGMPLEQIKLPPVSHFFFCNHWHKNLPFSSIIESFDETTKKISARNKIAQRAA